MIETHELDEAAAILRDQFGVRLGVSGERPGLRIDQHSLGDDLQLAHVTYELQAAVTSSGMPQLYLTRLRRGWVRYQIGDQDNRWGPGALFVVSNADTAWQATLDNADCEFLAIDPAVLSEVAPTDDGRPVAMTGYEPVTPSAAAAWQGAYDYARQAAALSELSPLVTAATRRLLAAATLATFPNTARTEPTSQDRRDAHPATLRRAITYIDSHLHQDFTATEIAKASYVTPRALQLAFRRHLATTPMAYARRARLDQARRDLLAAQPEDGHTVTSIARRWGFGDPGRFAQQYQRTFGELPSRTLHR